MFSSLYSEMIIPSVTALEPRALARQGIRVVFCDLDNTLAKQNSYEIDKETAEWIEKLEREKITLWVLSNNSYERVATFCDKRRIRYSARCHKPNTKYVLAALDELGLSPSDAIMIGDKVFTDVRCGKRAKIFTALVEPLELGPLSGLRRKLEAPFRKAPDATAGQREKKEPEQTESVPDVASEPVTVEAEHTEDIEPGNGQTAAEGENNG